ARSSHAANPYLAVKMFYLAIYPMAIGAAVLFADLWVAALRAAPRLRAPAPPWIAAAMIGVASAQPSIGAPRPRPVVTEPVLPAHVADLHALPHAGRLPRLLAAPRGVRQRARVRPRDRG